MSAAVAQRLDAIVPTVRTRPPRGVDMNDRNDRTNGNEPASSAGITHWEAVGGDGVDIAVGGAAWRTNASGEIFTG